jgi:hypothetical protein
MASLKNTTVDSTGAIVLPSGTTAQRPSLVPGSIRYNSSFNVPEFYDGINWRFLPDMVRTGLVAYYDPGEPSSYPGSGTALYDVSGNNRLATLFNGPTYNSSNGGSLLYDGVDDFGQSGNFTPNITDKTLCGWAKLSNLSQTGGALIGLQSESGAIFDALVYNEGGNTGWRFGSDNNGRALNSLVYETSTSEWVFIAGTWANNDYRIYRNAALIGTRTDIAARVFDFTSRINVGQRHTGGGSNFLAANISATMLYDRVLSQEEIQENFNAMRGRFGV